MDRSATTEQHSFYALVSFLLSIWVVPPAKFARLMFHFAKICCSSVAKTNGNEIFFEQSGHELKFLVESSDTHEYHFFSNFNWNYNSGGFWIFKVGRQNFSYINIKCSQKFSSFFYLFYYYFFIYYFGMKKDVPCISTFLTQN